VVTAEAIRIPTYIVIPVVLIPVLLLALIITLLYYRLRKPAVTEEDVIAWYFSEDGPGNRKGRKREDDSL